MYYIKKTRTNCTIKMMMIRVRASKQTHRHILVQCSDQYRQQQDEREKKTETTLI